MSLVIRFHNFTIICLKHLIHISFFLTNFENHLSRKDIISNQPEREKETSRNVYLQAKPEGLTSKGWNVDVVLVRKNPPTNVSLGFFRGFGIFFLPIFIFFPRKMRALLGIPSASRPRFGNVSSCCFFIFPYIKYVGVFNYSAGIVNDWSCGTRVPRVYIRWLL